MVYFVYQTTNIINNNIYVGVHSTSNIDDGYLGSGNRLNYAIKKYGKENFTREILKTFDCLEEAYIFEAFLVDEEFVKRKDTYNIKLGGLGGFYHINQFPPDIRPNIISIKDKVKKGTYTGGGSNHWPDESRQKVINQARLNATKNRELGLCYIKGSRASEETKKILSEKAKGENNSNYGKKWYIHKDDENVNNRKTFIPGNEPENFITTEEWKRNKLKGTGSTFNTHWYNNGKINKLFRNNEVPEGFIKGRIK